MLKQLCFLFLIAFATSEIIQENSLMIEENIEEKHEYDWDTLMLCLKEFKPFSKPIRKLIILIRLKKFESATVLINKLIKRGNQLIKKCIPSNDIILEVNWKRVLSCLVSIGKSVPGLVKIIAALKTFNIPKVIILAIKLGKQAKAAFKACKRQG